MTELNGINELLVWLESVASAGWVYLLALLAVATGLLIFDRQPKQAGADQARPSQERMAA